MHYKLYAAIAATLFLHTNYLCAEEIKEPPKYTEEKIQNETNTPKTISIPIVFITKKNLEEQKFAGTLTENTFYWSNIMDEGELTVPPEIIKENFDDNENQTDTITLKGYAPNKNSFKSVTVATLTRVFNIPSPTPKSVTISAQVKRNYDEWADTGPEWTSTALVYSFFKDGVEVRKNSEIKLPERPVTYNAQNWKTVSISSEVPANAQQLVITAKADAAESLSLANLQISLK